MTFLTVISTFCVQYMGKVKGKVKGFIVKGVTIVKGFSLENYIASLLLLEVTWMSVKELLFFTWRKDNWSVIFIPIWNKYKSLIDELKKKTYQYILLRFLLLLYFTLCFLLLLQFLLLFQVISSLFRTLISIFFLSFRFHVTLNVYAVRWIMYVYMYVLDNE